jgi:hypothetical protein
MLTFWIGGRELDDARRMLKDLTSRCQGKPLFVSDELPHYGKDRIFRPKTPTMAANVADLGGPFQNCWPIQRYVNDMGTSPDIVSAVKTFLVPVASAISQGNPKPVSWIASGPWT